MTWRIHLAANLTTTGKLFGEKRYLAFSPFVFAGLFFLADGSAQAQIASPGFVVAGGITFIGLSGPNLSPYTGSIEGNFAVTPTSGTWLESTIYGNPGPSIFAGPVNSPGPAVIQITDNAGDFNLRSFDFSSNNGNSLYVVEGFQGSTLAYEQTGDVPGTFGPFSFSTLVTADPTVAIDGLLIDIIPQTGTTSVNLDNIEVSTVPLVVVPEPASYALWGGGLGLVSLIRLRTKTGQ
jgi:hypothetical protein